MKKLLILLTVLIFVSPLLAQDLKISIPFRTLQLTGTAMTWCDFTFTTWALSTGNYGEANPIARFYVDHTAIAIPIIIVTDLFINWGLSSIYEDNKPLAWGMLIAFTAARAYIMYRNFKIVRQ